jgi:hypothetical protein
VQVSDAGQFVSRLRYLLLRSGRLLLPPVLVGSEGEFWVIDFPLDFAFDGDEQVAK